MRIFLAWAKPRSKAVATALHDWLQDALQYVKPFMSQIDIDSGDRGLLVLREQLAETHFGIICVTPENQLEPWINFEAGALGKSIDRARVVPYLLDIRGADLRHPLAQFQWEPADLEGTQRLVSSINKSAPTAIDDARVGPAVARCWPELEAKLAAARALPHEAATGPSVSDKVDEILESVRALRRRPIGHHTTDPTATFMSSRRPLGAREFASAFEHLLGRTSGNVQGIVNRALHNHRRRMNPGRVGMPPPAPFDMPFEDRPFKDAPFEDMPFEDMPFKDAPFEDVPVKDVPVKDVPLSEVPPQDAPPRTDHEAGGEGVKDPELKPDRK